MRRRSNSALVSNLYPSWCGEGRTGDNNGCGIIGGFASMPVSSRDMISEIAQLADNHSSMAGEQYLLFIMWLLAAYADTANQGSLLVGA